jgi:hypothetical protein
MVVGALSESGTPLSYWALTISGLPAKKNRRGRSESEGPGNSQLAYPLSGVVEALSGEAPSRWWTFVANSFLLALAVALVLGVAEVRSN